jgi:hypothetical protein
VKGSIDRKFKSYFAREKPGVDFALLRESILGEPPERHSQTRRHHYVPAFLLQGFTPSGQRDDFLWVHDREQGKAWRAKPDQAAHERDYYRVEIPETDPNIVETTFSQMEGQASLLLQEMIRSHQLPHGEDFQVLIGFVTLLALRTPSFRGMYERNMEHLYRHQAKVFLARRELFDQFIEEKRKEGVEIPPEITYEGLRDFAFDDERYTVEIPRTKSVQMLLEMWQSLVPIFLDRRWSLFYTRPDERHLFCSDMPVSITPTSPDFKPRFLGFGLRQTELTIPLSRSIALVGSYEAPSITAEMPLGLVRETNNRTLSFAERFLYSAEKSLVI